MRNAILRCVRVQEALIAARRNLFEQLPAVYDRRNNLAADAMAAMCPPATPHPKGPSGLIGATVDKMRTAACCGIGPMQARPALRSVACMPITQLRFAAGARHALASLLGTILRGCASASLHHMLGHVDEFLSLQCCQYRLAPPNYQKEASLLPLILMAHDAGQSRPDHARDAQAARQPVCGLHSDDGPPDSDPQ